MERDRQKKKVQVAVAADVKLDGNLIIPHGASGVVLFAHGSGSSRRSPRNQYVARVLNDSNLATLLIDLLTPEEAQVDVKTRHLRFDIAMLSRRIAGAMAWLGQQAFTRDLKIGLFGASTGAGAALVAAADRPDVVEAVVSRGGRPDLAGEALADVRAPTLLIVGGSDKAVIGLNRDALDQLSAVKQIAIVPGATHLFEEPGSLAAVAAFARDWFSQYLTESDS